MKAGHESLGNEHQRDIRENEHGIDGFKKGAVFSGVEEDDGIAQGNAREEQHQTQRHEYFAHDIAHLFQRIADIVLMGTQPVIKAEADEDDQRARAR